jgi:hypothetical protein
MKNVKGKRQSEQRQTSWSANSPISNSRALIAPLPSPVPCKSGTGPATLRFVFSDADWHNYTHLHYLRRLTASQVAFYFWGTCCTGKPPRPKTGDRYRIHIYTIMAKKSRVVLWPLVRLVSGRKGEDRGKENGQIGGGRCPGLTRQSESSCLRIGPRQGVSRKGEGSQARPGTAD